jgi:predicted flap endonuclease-1-like 5' DNA nuclease
MRHHSIARFTATALIVAAVLLFILAFIPVIAVAVGGLGAGWGAGSRMWLVFPLAVGACTGALLLAAFGAMLLVLTRIQDNLLVWRQRQAEAAETRAVALSPQEEIAPAAVATAAVATDAIATPETEAAGAEITPTEPGVEVSDVAAGAALAGVAVAAAEGREEEAEPAVAGVQTVEGEAEGAATPAVEASAPEEEAGHPGRAAVLAGAGLAAAAALAHDEKTEPAEEEGVTPVAETAAAQVEVAASEEAAGGVGLGAVLAGAGIAAAVAAGAGGEEAEPEVTPIPATAPEPEPGAAKVEITEAEAIPAIAEEAGGPGAAAALAAAGLAVAATREGEAEPQPEPATIEEAVAAVEAPVPETAAPAEPAHPVAWAYDKGTANVTKAAGAVKVEGIGQVYAGKLKEMGITTTAALLRAGATPKGRKELAEKSGISPKQILKWVNRVDLSRIKGISEQYADLLEAAGVDTVPELAQRNAESLLQKLVETNEAKRLVRRLPTLGMVSNWIAQAKELPRVIVYK